MLHVNGRQKGEREREIEVDCPGRAVRVLADTRLTKCLILSAAINATVKVHLKYKQYRTGICVNVRTNGVTGETTIWWGESVTSTSNQMGKFDQTIIE